MTAQWWVVTAAGNLRPELERTCVELLAQLELHMQQVAVIRERSLPTSRALNGRAYWRSVESIRSIQARNNSRRR